MTPRSCMNCTAVACDVSSTRLIGGLGEARAREALAERRDDLEVGPLCRRRAAQVGRAARLQAQPGCIARDVRSVLVDHADDAERHPHPLDAQPVRPHRAFDDLADRGPRVPATASSPPAIAAIRAPSRREPVEPARRYAVVARSLDVALVGRQDHGCAVSRARRRGEQCVVLRWSSTPREHAGGRPHSRLPGRRARVRHHRIVPWSRWARRGRRGRRDAASRRVAARRLVFVDTRRVRSGPSAPVPWQRARRRQRPRPRHRP